MPVLPCVVIDETDWNETELRILEQLFSNHFAGVTGSGDEYSTNIHRLS